MIGGPGTNPEPDQADPDTIRITLSSSAIELSHDEDKPHEATLTASVEPASAGPVRWTIHPISGLEITEKDANTLDIKVKDGGPDCGTTVYASIGLESESCKITVSSHAEIDADDDDDVDFEI